MDEFKYIVSFYALVTKTRTEVTTSKWWRFLEKPSESLLEWTQKERFSIMVTEVEGKELLRRQKSNPHNDNMWNILFRALSGQDSHNISMLQIEVLRSYDTNYVSSTSKNVDIQ